MELQATLQDPRILDLLLQRERHTMVGKNVHIRHLNTRHSAVIEIDEELLWKLKGHRGLSLQHAIMLNGAGCRDALCKDKARE